MRQGVGVVDLEKGLSMAIVIFWTGIAIACSIVAYTKDRSRVGWFLLGLLFSLLSLLIILVLPSLKKAPEAPSDETHVKCPACAELIRREAVKCKHCGEAVTPQPFSTKPAISPDPHEHTATLLGGVRAGRYWSLQGRLFENAKDLVEFARNPEP